VEAKRAYTSVRHIFAFATPHLLPTLADRNAGAAMLLGARLTCEFMEIQRFKNQFNVEHELVMGEFKSLEETISVAVQRSSKYPHLDHEPTVDNINQQARHEEESNYTFPSALLPARAVCNGSRLRQTSRSA
jgi:hypothetical protein